MPGDPPAALVVDDEFMVRFDAIGLLEDAGFRTLEAENAEAALDVLAEHHADIVLLLSDVLMPGPMDGFGLARETARRWPHVGIMVASGRTRPLPGDLPDGAHFVAKPFTDEVVRDHLRELLPDGAKPDTLRRP